MIISLVLRGFCAAQFPTGTRIPISQGGVTPTGQPPSNNVMGGGGPVVGGMMPPFGPMEPHHPNSIHFVGAGYNILMVMLILEN